MKVKIGEGEWIDAKDIPIYVEFSTTDRRSLENLSPENPLMVNYNPRLFDVKDIISWAQDKAPLKYKEHDHESPSR